MAERCITVEKVLKNVFDGHRRTFSTPNETIVVIDEADMEKFIEDQKPQKKEDEFGTYQEPSSLDDTQEIVVPQNIDFENY